MIGPMTGVPGWACASSISRYLPLSSVRGTRYRVGERTDPKNPIVLSPDQVPTKVEWIMDSSMGSNKSLSLRDRLELSRPPFSYAGCLVRLLCPIFLIPFSTVDRLRNQFPVRDSITT